MAKPKKISIGVIGAGGRAHLINNIKGVGKDVELRAVYDPDKDRAKSLCDAFGVGEREICKSYEDVANCPDLDWVMIFSPNCHHKEHIVAAFGAGKNVFSEKPLATTIDDCKAIHKAHEKSGVLFATGFVLRYSPLYRKIRQLLDEGYIGKILSIDANENVTPAHGSYIMKNWRRFTKISGPHILEKCCHDLDLLNWFVGTVPSKVASFGGCDLFIPENKNLPKKFKKGEGKTAFKGWHDPHGVNCPFSSEKDIIDNQVAIMEYRNNVRVMFQATLSNAIPERRMYISGTEGNIVAELYTNTLRAKRLDSDYVQSYDSCGGDMHGGGDRIIMEELYDCMKKNTAPKCGGEEGLRGSVTALGIDQARVEGRVVDLEPVWRKLGV
ncbi:MAG: hypothetical protein A2X49_16290 [Lentisphaerae bacterium GWF2_52_8]|nr:MAG: hypothetical protein A2X49_16290 [Lentisphaerae bacterium GWF2_52_8]